MPIEELKVKSITTDPAIIARKVPLDVKVKDEYAELMASGVEFPPIRVFRIGNRLVVTDGRHRWGAAWDAKIPTIRAEVIEGTLDDAIWDCCAGNQGQNGLRRSRADKEVAIRNAIAARPEVTNSMIARHVQVDDETVTRVRTAMEAEGKIEVVPERTDAAGKKRVQKSKEQVTIPVGEDRPVRDTGIPFDAPPPPPSNPVDDAIADPKLPAFLDRIKRVHAELHALEGELKILRLIEDRLPYVAWGKLLSDLPMATDRVARLAEYVVQGIPHSPCHDCRGSGCVGCHQSGYWPKWKADGKLEYGED